MSVLCTWENWKGIDGSGVPHDSLNHYSAGSVAAWLFGYCGGIRPAEAGFKKIKIRPMPGGNLTWANTSYDSIRGRIVSNWKIENSTFLLNVTIPDDTTAVICLPDGTVRETRSGNYHYQCKYMKPSATGSEAVIEN